MDYLRRNTEKFNLNLNVTGQALREVIFEGKEDLMVEPQDGNRVLYLGSELYGIETVENLLERLGSKSILLLYYENPQDMVELLSKMEFTCDDGRVFFVTGSLNEPENLTRLHNILAQLVYTFTKISPIIKMSDDIHYIKRAKVFLSMVSDYRESHAMKLGNDLDDTFYGIHNRLRNLSRYIQNPGFDEFVKRYGHLYKNKPAFIVATGPSLDKNVHLLKDYQDTAFILSCDCSLNTLEKNGIMPDVMGTVERDYIVYDKFYKDREIDDQIVFSGPAVVREEIVRTFDNKFLSFYKDPDVYGRWMNGMTLGKKGMVFGGASVAHLLCKYAEGLGCNPIVLMGQDLAYSENGVSHSGDAEVVKTVDLDSVDIWVRGINGDQLPSTRIWKFFLDIYEEVVRESDAVYIDASEGGAYIDGTEVRTLKEVLSELCTTPKPNFRALVDSIDVHSDYVNEAFGNTIAELEGAIEKFNHLLELAEEAMEMNARAGERLAAGLETQAQLDEVYDAIEFADRRVVNTIVKDAFFMMLFQYPIQRVIKAINNLGTEEFTLETIEENVRLHKELLSLIAFNSKRAIRTLLRGSEDLSADAGEFGYRLDHKKYYDKYSDWIHETKYGFIMK